MLGAIFAPARRWLGHRIRWFQSPLSGGKLHRFYPTDFLNRVKLGAPRSKVLKMLGDPDYESTDRWSYHYKELALQLAFHPDQGSLETIIMGFVGRSGKDSVQVSWLDKKLGDFTLADAGEYSENGLRDLQYSQWIRSHGVVLQVRTGPSGAFQHLSFGALVPFIGPLADTSFEWNQETEKLASDPAKTLVNWVAISSDSFDNSWFDYTVIIPSH